MNSAAGAWSSDEAFILIDVLIAVMIISLCATLLSQTVRLNNAAKETMTMKTTANEEAYRSILSGTPECIPCEETTAE